MFDRFDPRDRDFRSPPPRESGVTGDFTQTCGRCTKAEGAWRHDGGGLDRHFVGRACSVWYHDCPAGHQPPPTSCRSAKLTAARDHGRVLYGGKPNR